MVTKGEFALTDTRDVEIRLRKYVNEVRATLDQLPFKEIAQLSALLLRAYESGSNIFIMGNGGSASTSSHFVVDINKGVSYGLEKRFKMICLNDNVPSVMAYANDVSYDDVFVEQLKNFVRQGDLVIGISGSGNSENVVRAIKYANDIGANTVGLAGFDGGRLSKLARYAVVVPVNDMQKTEDIHLMV